MVFKVNLAKLPITGGSSIERWFIYNGILPVFEINDWLDSKSSKSIGTGKKYAYTLVKYLNFLVSINKTYPTAKRRDFLTYLKSLVFLVSDQQNTLTIDPQITYSTLSGHVTIVTEFYRWLDEMGEDYSMEMKKGTKPFCKDTYLFGPIWNYEYSTIIEKYILRLKPSKFYKKWYTEEEKEVLLSNFRTLRDKVVFLLTLEGLRIDEALSIHLCDWDPCNRVVRPSRSKGHWQLFSGRSRLRPIVLPEYTARQLERYLQTERADAEIASQTLSDWLFINLNKGKKQAEPLQYHNFLGILKRCAKRAGIDPSVIRTHSGRSTKVMELLEHQSLHPEDNITDLMIQETLGWKDPKSISPYRDIDNPIIAKAAAEKIHRRRKKYAN